MPAKHVVKTYIDDGYYHVYNRGVEKRITYEDERDYATFLSFLKEYLSPPPDPQSLKQVVTFEGATFKGIAYQPKNYSTEIELLAYCLMPNHFHLLIHQRSLTAMHQFMQSLGTRYTMSFNKRYQRTGSLFQGTYKAVLVTEEPYLLHLTRYIHRNPLDIGHNIAKAYSSYPDYLGLRNTQWVKPQTILSFFDQATLPIKVKTNTYQQFVEYDEISDNDILGTFAIDST